MSASGPRTSKPVDQAAIVSILEQAIRSDLPRWLQSRRWFADKGRVITSIELEEAWFERVRAEWPALAIVRIVFADGEPARYFLPLAVTWSAVERDAIVILTSGDDRGALVDATLAPWFGGWFLGMFAMPAHAASHGWTFAAPAAAEDWIAAARSIPAAVSPAEQSNTSLRFGDSLMIKLIRRLQPGPNPDEEILRALDRVGFAHVPRFLGAVSWQAEDGLDHPVALLQAFAPNVGDGWSWTAQRLADIAAGGIDATEGGFAPERLLGRRTGELHVALSTIADDDFAAVAGEEETIQAHMRHIQAAVGHAATLLWERRAYLPEPLRDDVPRLIDGLRRAETRAEGFRDELRTRRIRVHGDFHLGQTLRTPDADWAIIDFEGEPARPVAERRRKTSALKDVAGMLRSFGYARGAAERAAAARGGAEVGSRLAEWEAGARGAFLEGYREALADAPVPLAPLNDAAFSRAVSAWELDKALYEIAYEARNRPDWLELPLRGLVTEALDQPADATGAAPA